MSNRFELVVDEQLRAHHNKTCNSFPVEYKHYEVYKTCEFNDHDIEIGQVHDWVFGLNSHTCPLSNFYILGEYLVMKNSIFFLAHKKKCG